MSINATVNEAHELSKNAGKSPAITKAHELSPTKPDALTITPTLRQSLRRLAENTYRRGPRTWTTPSAPDISFHTITEAKVRNLVRIKFGTGRDRVVLTQLGKEVADMVAKRRKRSDA